MGSIQLGINVAVGSMAGAPDRDVLMQDFNEVAITTFPRDGSNLTPAHEFSVFKFKSYADVAFRYFRDLFKIKADEYLVSF